MDLFAVLWLVLLFSVGFVPALVMALLLRRGWLHLLFAGVGLLVWVAATQTAGHSSNESDTPTWVWNALLGAILIGWWAGLGVHWIVFKTVERSSARPAVGSRGQSDQDRTELDHPA